VAAKPIPTAKKDKTFEEPLRFRVASHVVQDFGLNLYTSLPRVLVEFVANAHDADAAWAKVKMDGAAIETQRRVMKAEFEVEKAKAAPTKKHDTLLPLKERLLPDSFTITIEDNGHGMSRGDLASKFLIAGRRRRLEEGKTRTDKGRIIMGRKGLGKLAGFGVAHRVEVTSRKKGEGHATRVTLDYDELIAKRLVDEVALVSNKIDGGDGLSAGGGTRIVLSRLVYEATKSRDTTIENEIADHFSSIKPEEFTVFFNGDAVEPTPRPLYWAWPKPDLPVADLVEQSLTTDEGETMKFKYRIRFTPRGQSLRASERGVRVYANRRLAASPSLLDVKTGIHGFRNTEYLDGVVEADFIDQDATTDYIATDRQSLRWEVSQLGKLKEFLSEQMTTACFEFQKVVDKDNEEKTKKDVFTTKLIDEYDLPKHRKETATRVATILAGTYAGDVESPEYKTQLRIFMDGLAQGDILGALRKLANQQNPKFAEVVDRITELTEREIGDFMKYVEGRLEGIHALRKLFLSVDFKKAKNEHVLHELFERNPWLIDPAFSQYVTSDLEEHEVLERLEKELEINRHVPKGYDPAEKSEAEAFGTNRRPDLVFLLANLRMKRIVVVELKAPNTPLLHKHQGQLLGYMGRLKTWLKAQNQYVDVRGILIGSIAAESQAAEVVELREAMEHMRGQPWAVLDIGEVLEQTKTVHEKLLSIRERAAKYA
jgi:hypothetical protein